MVSFSRKKSGVLVSGETYSISVKLYVPSDNTNSNLNFNVRENGGGTIVDCNLTEANAWQTFTASLTAGAGLVLQVTSDVSMTSGDVLYIKDLVVTQTSNSNGFVKTWYDQSVTTQAGDTATGNHATQSTASKQPKIVNAGSLLNELDFDGTDDTLAIDFGADLSQASSFFIVHQSDTTTDTANEFFDSAASASPRTLLDQSGSDYRMLSGSTGAGTGVAITTNKSLIFALYNGSSSLFAKNGTTTSALNAGTTDIKQNSTIGSSNTRFYDGSMQEFIIYNSDQTDNRTAIEANMGEHYSISGIPAFDNSVNGFVETWYDQSGNGRDAVQATAANQPKIVENGSLLTLSGKPTIKPDGTNDFLINENSIWDTISNSALSCFTVTEKTSLTNRILWAIGSSSNEDGDWLIGGGGTAGNVQFRGGRVVSASSSIGTSGTVLLTALDVSGGDGFVNGTAIGSPSSTTPNVTADRLVLFNRRGSSSSSTFTNQALSEIIFYSFDATDNRTALETNINGHYSIF